MSAPGPKRTSLVLITTKDRRQQSAIFRLAFDAMIKVVCAPKFIDNTYSEDSFALFDGDLCVGHVLRTSQAPEGKPWFWTIFTRGVSAIPDRGYAVTREQAIEDAKARLSSAERAG